MYFLLKNITCYYHKSIDIFKSFCKKMRKCFNTDVNVVISFKIYNRYLYVFNNKICNVILLHELEKL